MSEIWLDKPYRSLSQTELFQIKRDICYLYHELAEYCGMMGDLDYSEVYSLPYWEYLNISGLLENEKVFVQTGCLMLILAMVWESLSDAGAYIMKDKRIAYCENAIKMLEGNNPTFYRLVDTVQLGLSLVKEKNIDEQAGIFSKESSWAFQEFVLGYFKQISEKCSD